MAFNLQTSNAVRAGEQVLRTASFISSKVAVVSIASIGKFSIMTDVNSICPCLYANVLLNWFLQSKLVSQC